MIVQKDRQGERGWHAAKGRSVESNPGPPLYILPSELYWAPFLSLLLWFYVLSYSVPVWILNWYPPFFNLSPLFIGPLLFVFHSNTEHHDAICWLWRELAAEAVGWGWHHAQHQRTEPAVLRSSYYCSCGRILLDYIYFFHPKVWPGVLLLHYFIYKEQIKALEFISSVIFAFGFCSCQLWNPKSCHCQWSKSSLAWSIKTNTLVSSATLKDLEDHGKQLW